MNSQKVNIPSHIKDPNYRYKMPKMILKQESRLNGVKTNVFNLDDVAKSLRVPKESIIKWWCAELGVSKEKKTILKGQHNYEVLLNSLDKFIEKYVLCKKCNYPETSMFVKQKKLLSKCRACGNQNNLDGTHRAGAYLMKVELFDDGEIKNDDNNAGEKGGQGGEQQEEDKAEEQIPKVPTQQAKDESVEGQLPDLVDAINQVSELATNKATTKEISQILTTLQSTFEFPKECVYYILLCGIYTKDRNILKNWDSYQECFALLIAQDQKKESKLFIQALIIYFIKKYPEIKKFAPTLLKKFYDEEFLSEEFFMDFMIKWHKRKKKLDNESPLYNKKAQQEFRELINEFIDWLESAEEEGGEEYDAEVEGQEQSQNQASSPTKTDQNTNASVNDALKKQQELIAKQKEEQQKMMEAKKEEANRLYQERQVEMGSRVNVMDIEVNDDFEVDDI